MATVTTPSGERLEGVTGDLLAYYRGEANTVGGYVIEDDESTVTFPRVFDGEKYVEPEPEQAPVGDGMQTHPGYGELMHGVTVPADGSTVEVSNDPAGQHAADDPSA